jgi:hypothetical protein
MLEPIENEYFNWLCAKVLERNGRIYHSLLKILYQTEFVWVVPADRHRVDDALELRADFQREANAELENLFEILPVSVFEVLISFADRASFQTDAPVREWFWKFMENLNLDQFRQVTGSDEAMINEILDSFIWRTYDPHGYGGLFPITRTDRDQRKLEIWFQFCEYVEDRGLI